MLEALKMQHEIQVRGIKSEGTLEKVTYLNSDGGPEPAKQVHVKDDCHAVQNLSHDGWVSLNFLLRG